MPERSFLNHTITRSGRPTTAMRIECAECEATADFLQTSGRQMPPIAAQQHFRNLGWRVGNGPRADVCPECLKKKQSHLKVVSMDIGDAVKPIVDAPREMSRDDRRLVYEKIEEVYLDEKSGYSPPWTDLAVARDLGCPMIWVRKVREEMFGPEGSNPEYSAFLEQIAPLITECKNLFGAARSQLDQAKALIDQAHKLEAKIDDVSRIGRKVEKEIGR